MRAAAAVPPVRRALSSRAAIVGVSVSDTSAEIATAIDSVTENSRNSRPTMPPMNRIGMNTAISDTVIDTIVKPICLAPVERRRQRVGSPASM